jgi:uncharacterized membrane protein
MAESEVLYSVSKTKSPIKEILLFTVFVLSAAVIYMLISSFLGNYGLLPLVIFALVSIYALFLYSRSSTFEYVNIMIGGISAVFLLLLLTGTITILPSEYWAFIFVVFLAALIRSRFSSTFLNTESNELKLFAIIVIIGLFFLFISYFIANFISLLERSPVYVDFQNIIITFYDNKMNVDRTLSFNLDSGNRYHEIFISVNKDSYHSYAIESYDCPIGTNFMESDKGTYVEYICRSEKPYNLGHQIVRFEYSVSAPYRKDKTKDLYSLNYVISDSFASTILETSVSVQNKMSNGNLTDYFTYPYGTLLPDKIYIADMKPSTPFSIRALISSPTFISSYARSTISDFDFERVKINALLDKILFDYRIIVHILMALLFVFLIYSIYNRYGKEDKTAFEIDSLHTIPNEDRKPWEVNLLFVGTPSDMDSNAIHATLLDLEFRKIISIKDEKTIVYSKKGYPDEYESLLLNIFERYGEMTGTNQYTFNYDKAKAKLKSDVSLASSFSKDFSALISYPSSNSGKQTYGKALIESSFDISGYDKAKGFISGALLLALASITLFYSVYKLEFMIPVLVFLSILLIMVISFGEFLFGKFRLGLIDEKKKWDAFSNLLSNYGMIQKYGKEDILMWKNWLVFAAALGVAEKAIEQMKKYNMATQTLSAVSEESLAKTKMFTRMSLYGMNTYAAGIASPSKGGYGGSSGGFGGGGFGGGGGGAR